MIEKLSVMLIVCLTALCSGCASHRQGSVFANPDSWTLDKAMQIAPGERRNGQPLNGAFYDWYAIDQKALMFYETGQLHGPVTAWNDAGGKRFEGQHTRGERSGTWYHWDTNGTLVAEGTYRRGRPWNGTFLHRAGLPEAYVDGILQPPRIHDEWHTAPDGSFSFRISAAREQYQVGETVAVLAELRNNSPSNISVLPVQCAFGNAGDAITVSGPNAVRYRGPFKTIPEPEPVILRPGEEVQAESGIDDRYEGFGAEGRYDISVRFCGLTSMVSITILTADD